MKPARLALLLLPGVLRRYRTTLSVGALGSALVLVLLAVVAAGADSAGGRLDGLASRSLRTVEVDSYSPRGDVTPLTAGAIDHLASMRLVESATGWAQQGITLIGPVGASSTADPVQVWATPVVPAVQPRYLQGVAPAGLAQLGVPRSAARSLGLAPGSRARVEYTRKESGSGGVGVDETWTITGVYDDSVVGIDGPDAAYASAAEVQSLVAAANGQSTAWARQSYVYPKAYLVATSLSAVPELQTTLARTGYAATGLAARATALPRLAQLLAGLQLVALIVLLLFLVVSGWIVAGSLVAARRTEVGLLRGLGWLPGRVARVFTVQMAAMGLLVGAVGLVLGLAGSVLLGAVAGGATVLGLQLGTGLQLPGAGWLATALLAPVVVYALTGAVPIVRAARLPPDEVLRDL